MWYHTVMFPLAGVGERTKFLTATKGGRASFTPTPTRASGGDQHCCPSLRLLSPLALPVGRSLLGFHWAPCLAFLPLPFNKGSAVNFTENPMSPASIPWYSGLSVNRTSSNGPNNRRTHSALSSTGAMTGESPYIHPASVHPHGSWLPESLLYLGFTFTHSANCLDTCPMTHAFLGTRGTDRNMRGHQCSGHP